MQQFISSLYQSDAFTIVVAVILCLFITFFDDIEFTAWSYFPAVAIVLFGMCLIMFRDPSTMPLTLLTLVIVMQSVKRAIATTSDVRKDDSI